MRRRLERILLALILLPGSGLAQRTDEAFLSQPLWNEGREVTSPSLSKNLQQAADAGEMAALSDRILTAVAVYVDAVRARQAVEADSVGLAAARLFHTAAVDRYRQGLVPELDTLRPSCTRSTRIRLRPASLAM